MPNSNRSLRRVAGSKSHDKHNESPTRNYIARPTFCPTIPESQPCNPPKTYASGFPTYDQYKRAEATYLNDITPRRRDKALITQAMFDRIWKVLHDPDTRSETPQFRFWVRKMFRLKPASEADFGEGLSKDRSVVFHNQLPVAIQEQLYQLLCYSHEVAGHGGRDKTCAVIRKHYSWVPKELVSQFIRVCPTCTAKAKRCQDVNDFVDKEDQNEVENGQLSRLRDVSNSFGYHHILDGESTCLSPTGDSLNHLHARTTDSDDSTSSSDSASAVEDFHLGVNYPQPSCSSQSHILRSLPMSREVSLFDGLPNAWEPPCGYSSEPTHLPQDTRQSDSYRCLSKTVDRKEIRPRIPSIIPLLAYRQDNTNLTHGLMQDLTLPPILPTSVSDMDSLPPSLQPLTIGRSIPQHEIPIDPVFLTEVPSPSPASVSFSLTWCDYLLPQMLVSSGGRVGLDGTSFVTRSSQDSRTRA